MTDIKSPATIDAKTVIDFVSDKAASVFRNVPVDLSFSGTSMVRFSANSGKSVVKVDLNFNTTVDDKVSSYYISFTSFWADADYADTLSYLLAGVASIARDLGSMGITARG